MNKVIKLGILGCGTVGTGVVKVLHENLKDIEARLGCELKISKILVRDLQKQRSLPEKIILTNNPADILQDSEIQIVVELLGGISPAKDYITEAIKNGKHVVTANKDIVAQYGPEIFELAEENNVEFMFEASVGGGIPIITPLKQCLAANKITNIIGIVNGTTNYMLTKMTELHMDYEEALARAQQKGYAEANPSADVDGLDAARKIAILSTIAFNTKVGLDDVQVEGITSITPADITCADELGFVIKLLATATKTEEGIIVSVMPTFIPKAHPLASVRSVFNAIFIHGNAIGDAMFYGKGAGEKPTASAVLADVIDVSRNILADDFNRIKTNLYNEKVLCPPEKIISCYFLRLAVEDKPGVLGKIATVFGLADVSLHSVIQKRKIGEYSEIVAVTHDVNNLQLADLKERLNGLDVVHGVSNIIPVIMPQEE